MMKTTPTFPTAATISASVKGSSHVRDNKPCQDAVSIKEGTFRGKPYLICSTADGHGGSAHKYSDVGSITATSAAEKTITQFLLSGDVNRDSRGALFANYIQLHLKEEWIENIKQACQFYRVSNGLIKKHGTTLLTVCIYDGYVYMAQLGDGEICYLDQDNNPVFLIKPETGPTNAVTSSLCSRDANNLWNFACFPMEEIQFLMMSTDGLMNSLAGCDEYLKLATTLMEYGKKFRPAEINAVLPEWLSEYSASGCGDDISVVAINFKTNNTKTGENNDNTTEHTRTEDFEKAGGRRPGRNLYRRKKWAALRFKAVQCIQRHPGAEKYYLLSCRGRCARCRMRR